MKIYKSLDFNSQQERIEPNTAGEYLVHLEDYESLNDLIRRSIRTKSVFVPESDKNAVYDDEIMDDIATEIDKTIIDQTPSADIETGENSSEVKQSGDEEQVQAPVENGNTALL